MASTYLPDDEATATWIHEIGHLFGLKHNPSPSSVMFCINVAAASTLDSQDLRAVSSLHVLRTIRMGPMGTEAL
jgi:predicted Zn-dependent protease